VTIGVGFPEVLAAARTGAGWAWERLVASIAGQLRGYIVAQGATDPDDLTGEVLLQLVRGIQSFEGDEAGFRSWVFLVAHHRVVDERRRRTREAARAAAQQPLDPAPPADAGLDSASGIDWGVRLSELSDDQRHVVLLRVVAGLSAEEVGRILGKRVGTVRVLQHRALARLRADMTTGVTK
jgi:RNA polymerase sigma-70 factor (ECF subfamily)